MCDFFFFFSIIQVLQQREIMNVFDDDWRLLGIQVDGGDWAGKVSEGLMLYQAFTDQQYSKDKKVSCVNWHPTIFGKRCNDTVRKRPHLKILFKTLQSLHNLRPRR